MSPNAPIDWSSLDQLTEEVGASVLPRLLGTFYGEAEKRLGTFSRLSQEGVPGGEGSQLHREVHSLKSAAASFGARALAMRAEKLEETIESGGYRHDPEVIAELVGLFSDFREAVARRGIVVG